MKETYYNKHVYFDERDLGYCWRIEIEPVPERERDVVAVKQTSLSKYNYVYDFSYYTLDGDEMIFRRVLD